MSDFVHSYTSESVHICVDIYKHPLLTGKAEAHMKLEHYKKGLNETTKGLATRPNQSPELEVEQRSLQVYEQLEGSDIN